jgi:ribosomal-protein-alanine N-acetyltransferase
MAFSLIRCDPNGEPIVPLADIPAAVDANRAGTADLYRRLGYIEPWVGYLAVEDLRCVGGGAFVGPPKDNCVEIAYFTVEGMERRGYASQTAAALVDIARSAEPAVQLKAYTLREENASTKILRRLGFMLVGSAHDDDAGEVWEWRT